MQLSQSTIDQINNQNVHKPQPSQFQLPEKILQFGTGVLLRGLCNYFIDEANRRGLFNGRIIVVKSTTSGGTSEFDEQDNLYTICVRGVDDGKIIKENIICAAISRIIIATTEWHKVLEAAKDPEIKVIISNTTEVGLQLVKESIHQSPPISFPAKLLSFLYRRYQHFHGNEDSKIIVIPTELISGNGNLLRNIIKDLSDFNQLNAHFKIWLDTNVYFCNSLVDRIVTRDPGLNTLNELQKELGYEDKLLTMCEDYRLWAIEGGEYVASVLSFTDADEGVFVTPDIEIYKSLKLHLLNGTHTFCSNLAYLSGFETVKEAMNDDVFFGFVESLMLEEIASSIPYQIDQAEKNRFGRKVLDRFSNPFLNHQWLNITLQNTTKMRNRNLPVLLRHHELFSTVPVKMAVGFAAYLLFMKVEKVENGKYFGIRNGEYYPVNDDMAEFFYNTWKNESDPAAIVNKVFANVALWGIDLSGLSAFKIAVTDKLREMITSGVSVVFRNSAVA